MAEISKIDKIDCVIIVIIHPLHCFTIIIFLVAHTRFRDSYLLRSFTECIILYSRSCDHISIILFGFFQLLVAFVQQKLRAFCIIITDGALHLYSALFIVHTHLSHSPAGSMVLFGTRSIENFSEIVVIGRIFILLTGRPPISSW